MDCNFHKGFIGVGSNIEPETNIINALRDLAAFVNPVASSTFYETTAIGREDQKNYLNGVWEIITDVSPKELKFNILRSIEKKLGRIRTKDKYDSRTIDLDLIIYKDLVINDPDLTVPDPDIYKRPFLSIPLYELSPDLLLPDTNCPIKEIADRHQSFRMLPRKEFTNDLMSIIQSKEEF